MKNALLQLAAKDGMSGFEFSLTEVVSNLLAPYCASVERDPMGNVVGVIPAKNPDAKSVMLEAHIDGIGLMVSGISEEGFLSFVPVGGVDSAILPGAEVRVWGKEVLYGVIGAKPPHLQTGGQDKATAIKDMYIDLGLCGEVVRQKVSVGDMVCFAEEPAALCNDVFSGKSFDDRAGLISLLLCLENLKGKELPFTIYVVAAVQEEVGLRGATMVSERLSPDCAFVVDVCHGDTPDAGSESIFKLGSGAVISFGPNIHPYLSSLAKEVAEKENIAASFDADGGDTGTDAWAVQVANGGIPVLLLSIPLRYMHTTVETLHFDDVQAVGDLLAAILQNLDLEVLACTFQN
ncbi:MAG: M20/M25/M40 family metallo-hydrolase [Clostridia bacterium]|nr:M20/M25/M40 family metallo-hydrolase [Clostridia bacterium]